MLAKLLERLLEVRSELGTDQVFDVVGEVFPANLLEKLFREESFSDSLLIPDPRERAIAAMAATNKCLAQENKSLTGVPATNSSQIPQQGDT